MSNFKIGQEVVTLSDSTGAPKGTIATVKEIRPSSCKCGLAEHYIGIDSKLWMPIFVVIASCGACVVEMRMVDSKIWYTKNEVAPLLS